ncbi:hypothetical protein M0R45_002198 [Rubus argutus]|uniref:Phytocyanin domain-containing protein n=1 Tax=Rubus argutus TaxID=59490 RepID=A0AAW1VSD3_RUBAR
MEFGRNLCVFFLVCLSSFLSATEGYKFYVGGRDGWVLNPSENYNHWAERRRFQVNDTLYFKYNKGSNSVLVVNKDNFFNCNTSNPIQKLEDGNSEFKFDRSGAFYFISGQDGNCAKGQKLIVIVLAVRNRQTPPAPHGSAPASAPSHGTAPASAPSQGSAPASAPSQGSAPASAPSQGSAPASSPSQATAPASSPSQGSAPAASPSHAPSTSPTSSPVPAPAVGTPTSSSPSAYTPVSSPPSPVGETPSPVGDTPTPSPPGEAPSGNVTASPPGSNQDSTAPKGNGSYGVTASSVLVSSVIVLASWALMSTFY